MTRHADATVLARRVRRRDDARLLALSSVAALIAVAAYGTALQAVVDPDDPRYDRTTDVVPPALGVLLVLALVGLVLMRASARGESVESRVARATIRLVRRPAEVVPGSPVEKPKNRREPASSHPIAYGLVFLVLGVVVLVSAGFATVSELRASAGHGGHVVTVGVDATLSPHTEATRTGTMWFLDLDDGARVSAPDGGEPQDGQRWLVKGNAAYRVGGHAWLAPLFAAVMSLALIAVGVQWLRSVRRHPATTVHDLVRSAHHGDPGGGHVDARVGAVDVRLVADGVPVFHDARYAAALTTGLLLVVVAVLSV